MLEYVEYWLNMFNNGKETTKHCKTRNNKIKGLTTTV